MVEGKELKIEKIRNGTVIDHVPSGLGLKVLKILHMDEDINTSVFLGIHVPSKKMGFKDIVKIENRFLAPKEIAKISLIAPSATVNKIKDYDIAEKYSVPPPGEVIGIVKCSNPNCVTNLNEPVVTEFRVVLTNPLRIKCRYCEREMEGKEIIHNII
ncbi:MAG: aspartate carbamoyltransferase regulatory subunit [Thermoplasmata archaeon]